MHPVRGSILAAAVLAAACTGTTGSTGALTLDTCGGTVGAGVPAFYAKYFKCVDVSMDGTTVVVTSTGLPPHASPYYAATDANHVAFDTQGGTRFQNPNSIAANAFTLRIPANPVAKGLTIDGELVDLQAGTSNQEYRGAPLGVSLDGVAMFHGVAAPGDDITREERTFDTYDGHPEMRGLYHYHSSTKGPLEVLAKAGLTTSTTPGEGAIELYAVMCDGTLVLGCTELDGGEPDTSGFDAQNGHVHDLKDEDGTTHFTARYHTHVCRSKFRNHLYAPEIQYYATCGN